MEWNSERYRGHTALCEIDLPGQKAIASATVAVAGAGGLGSAALIYLAAAGVGTLRIIDPDTVSESNLQRQVIHSTADLGRLKVDSAADTVRALNPDVKVETYPERLTAGNAARLLSGATVMLDCTDNFAGRMLIDDMSGRLGIPYVYGAVSRFSGHVFTRIGDSAGFRRIFGAEQSEPDCDCAAAGVLNTLVGTVGTLQATEALKVIAGTGDPLVNRLLVIDLLTMEFRTLRLG